MSANSYKDMFTHAKAMFHHAVAIAAAAEQERDLLREALEEIISWINLTDPWQSVVRRLDAVEKIARDALDATRPDFPTQENTAKPETEDGL